MNSIYRLFLTMSFAAISATCFGQNCLIPAASTCYDALAVVNNFSQQSSGTFSIDAPNIPGGRFTVMPDGRVGIGVKDWVAKQYTFLVNGSSWFNGPMIIDNQKSNNYLEFFGDQLGNKITLFKGSGSYSYGLGISSNQFNYRVLGTTDNHVFYAGGNNNNGTELMRIKGNGNVGIGIDPTEKLHVKGNIAMEIDGVKMWMNNSTDKQWGWFGTNSNHGLTLGANNAGVISITSKGDVGIGRIDPGAKLHVGGKSIFDDDVTFKKDVAFGGNFNLPGILQIPKSGYIQLGSDVDGRETAAGQIGYQKYSDGLDIVGAGKTFGDRTIAFWAQKHANFICHTDANFNNTIFTIGHSGDGQAWIGTASDHNLFFGTNRIGRMILTTSGNLLVGFDDSYIPKISPAINDKYDLFVHKGILSEDYAMASVSQWADYVFDKNYCLKPLSELDVFIRKNKHLPGILSQEEVKKDGYSIKDMNVKFLEKIEELTLYAIEQEKKSTIQDQKIKTLEQQLEQYKQLAAEVEKLKKYIN